MRVVDAGASRDVEPVGHVVFERGAEQETVLARVEHVAVGDPVGVLHLQALRSPRPVLHREVARSVVTLVNGVFADVVARRHEVNRDHRVVVLARREHVLLIDVHVHAQHAQVHALVEERRAVVGREVVTVVFVVRNDALGRHHARRNIGLALLAAEGESHRVRSVVSRLVEVGRRPRLLGDEFRTPRCVIAVLGSVGVLEGRG